MSPKSLDLKEFRADELESQLKGAKLENIDNLVLKCGADELVEKVLPVYNKFGDRLNGLKTLEIDVWIDAGKCSGPECAKQLLDGYDQIIDFYGKVKSDINKMVVNASSYNYNLDTLEDLHACLDKLKQRLNDLKITEDDSHLQKLLHTYENEKLRIELDVELRQAMDD